MIRETARSGSGDLMAGMDLGKQIGPLPLGAWVAVVAGGLGIALWSRNQGSNNDPTVVEDTSGDPGVGDGGSGQWVNVDPPSGTGNGDGITYDTNEAWGVAAINWLIAQGYSSGLANSAINKGLQGGTDIGGNKMSVQEWALWSLALAHFGSPPQPVSVQPPTSTPGPVTQDPDPSTPTPPTPKPPSTKTPAHYTYVSVHNDTLSGIATKTNKKYGLHNTWQTIYNFNVKYRSAASSAIIKKRGPNLFYTGTTWWIPK